MHPTRPDGSGLGAGVIVNADGAIMTAQHVVEARPDQVTFADGTGTAEIASTDPKNDIAVLQPDQVPSDRARGARRRRPGG